MTDLTGQVGLLRFGHGVVPQGIMWATDSHTYHVVVAVSDSMCISAEPGGVRYRAISDYGHVDWSRFDLSREQKRAIINAAHDMIGRPYNYAIYPPLLFQKLTGHKVDGWVAKWLAERPNENCSQLSTDIYAHTGIHLFNQLAEITTPGDFERLFVARGWL